MNHKALQTATRLSERLGNERLVSVIYYPEPFYAGGLAVVFRDEARSLIDLITETYKCIPREFSLRCLRRAELLELAFPTFTWLHVLNRHIQLAYRLKYKGTVIYGVDVLDEIPAPPDPKLLLNAHIESCAHFIRNHGVLRLLARGEYLEVINRLDWQMKHLMATALLERGAWDEALDSIPARFNHVYEDRKLAELWREFSKLKKSADGNHETHCRRTAYEAVWVFECFLRRLRSMSNESHNKG